MVLLFLRRHCSRLYRLLYEALTIMLRSIVLVNYAHDPVTNFTLAVRWRLN